MNKIVIPNAVLFLVLPRVTQVKAAALLDTATGRDVPRLGTQRAGKAG